MICTMRRILFQDAFPIGVCNGSPTVSSSLDWPHHVSLAGTRSGASLMVRFKSIKIPIEKIESTLGLHSQRGWMPMAMTLLPGAKIALVVLSTSKRPRKALLRSEQSRILKLIAYRTEGDAIQLVAQEFSVNLEEARAMIEHAETRARRRKEKKEKEVNRDSNG